MSADPLRLLLLAAAISVLVISAYGVTIKPPEHPRAWAAGR